MSRKPENTFIGSVHKHLPMNFHAEKMANPYRGGTPDCYYSGRLADMWVEYKFIERIPKSVGVVANLSALQTEWLRGRYEEGRSVFVIIGCKEGGVLCEGLTWESPIPSETFRALLVSRQEIARWILAKTGGPNDQIGCRDLQNSGDAVARRRGKSSDVRGSVRFGRGPKPR